jgi:hypothetical protein
MKKSDLRKIIRECVQEALTEATLYRDVDNYLRKITDSGIRDKFANWIVPFLRKSTEDKNQKLEYIKALRIAILSPDKAPAWLVNQMAEEHIDLKNPGVVRALSGMIPILSNFQKYIESQPVSE